MAQKKAAAKRKRGVPGEDGRVSVVTRMSPEDSKRLTIVALVLSGGSGQADKGDAIARLIQIGAEHDDGLNALSAALGL